MTRPLNLLHLMSISLLTLAVGWWLKRTYGSDWFEFAGFVTGVIGVYLVAVEHMINWPVGLINVSIYGWVFFSSRLYADMSLQVFFFILGVHGWWQWARGGEAKTALRITSIGRSQWLRITLIWVAGTAIYYPIIRHFNGAAPFLDSSLTVASIIAQILLNLKKLENWILWILVDAIYIPLYISRHLVATAVLYGLLLALAISGLLGWRRTWREMSRSEMTAA